MARILVVDDEESMRELLTIMLAKEGYEVRAFENPLEAVEDAGDNPPDLAIQDLKMPKMNGIELLRRLLEIDPALPVIIITAFSSWETAVEAMRIGAYDYIRKPFDNDAIKTIVRRAIEQRRLAPSLGLKDKPIGFESMVGDSKVMHDILKVVTRIAGTDSTVLISGESGTGKELVARAIHFHSLRSAGPFISVNCGAFTESILESELFGHVRGSFTGAFSDKKGLLEVANRGTFFLDEVADLAHTTQVKFLRVLEERRFIPVGSTEEKQLDVRFIAATNRNLAEEVKRGAFREDLFYRLNVIPIEILPLRQRKEDIPLLAGHFLAVYSRNMNKEVTSFSEYALRQLMSYDWPGNIRELDNVIQRAVALSDGPVVRYFETGGLTRPPGGDKADFPAEGFDLDKKIEEIERRYIEQALDRTDGNLTKAAELLGISFRSIRYKVKKLKLDKYKE
jgi:DNA-binding NtrC family response regulator